MAAEKPKKKKGKKTADGKKKTGNKKKKTKSSSISKKPKTEEEPAKKSSKEQAKIRNEKAKDVGVRLGGFLRSSLSFRGRSKSIERRSGVSVATDDVLDKSNRSRNTKRGEAGLDCSTASSRSMSRSRRSSGSRERGDDAMRLSIRSMSSKRSDKSQRSLFSLDDGDIESDEEESLMEKKRSKAPPSKAHLEARERLLRESQQAIERKNRHALMKRHSSHRQVTRATSQRNMATSLSPHVGSKPKLQVRGKSLERATMHSIKNRTEPRAEEEPLTPETESSGSSSEHEQSRRSRTYSEGGATLLSLRGSASSKPRRTSSFSQEKSRSKPKTRTDSLSQSEHFSKRTRPEPRGGADTLSQSEHYSNRTKPEPSRGVARSYSLSEQKAKASRSSPTQRSISRSRSMSERATRSKSPFRSMISSANKVDPNRASDWYSAIVKHDWETIEILLQSYDHTLYKDNGKSNSIPSPLLAVDANHRTSLHLSCIEHMPPKLLLKLLFVEREAAAVVDKDGRFALHLALLNNMSSNIVDRLIRAHPDGLGVPDNLNRTPLQYAVLKAEYQRTTRISESVIDGSWNEPTMVDHAHWQKQQCDAWGNVSFVLDSMVTRRKGLSPVHEGTVLLDSVRYHAPPEVMNNLLTVGGKILLDDAKMSQEFVESVFRLQYPVIVTKRTLKVASKVLPKGYMLDTIRGGLNDHYKRGCVPIARQGKDGIIQSSFCKELFDSYRAKQSGKSIPLTTPCQEWWDKLRFLIAYSSCRFNDDTDDIIVHAALTNPSSPPSLIEFLCRLLPSARYEIDVSSGGLPLHLACSLWNPNLSESQDAGYTRVLNLLMAGDVAVVRSRCKQRLPLHHALITSKPKPFIETLVSLDPKTAVLPDPVTRLFPFQLAALPPKRIRNDGKGSAKPKQAQDLEQISLVYDLLRSNAFPMSVILGCQTENMSSLTRHCLRWSYDWDWSGWKLNSERASLLRLSIRRGKLCEPLKQWWSTLKTFIWRASNDLVDNNGNNPMWKTPQNREYLLHAALWNCSQIPPIVIELIMELYPASVYTKQPGTCLYPLQIAAKSRSYRPFSFESVLSMNSSLEMLALLDDDAIKMKSSNGRLPLHDALLSGKVWHELGTMIEMAPESPLVRDPSTGLFPFQTAASIESFVPRHIVARAGRPDCQWTEASPQENAQTLSGLYDKYECEKLGSIYELLRSEPSALSPPETEDPNDLIGVEITIS